MRLCPHKPQVPSLTCTTQRTMTARSHSTNGSISHSMGRRLMAQRLYRHKGQQMVLFTRLVPGPLWAANVSAGPLRLTSRQTANSQDWSVDIPTRFTCPSRLPISAIPVQPSVRRPWSLRLWQSPPKRHQSPCPPPSPLRHHQSRPAHQPQSQPCQVSSSKHISEPYWL